MDVNINELVVFCENRWGSGSYLKSLGNDINNWLSNTTEEEREILIHLLKNFDYYPNRRASQGVQEIHTRVEKELQSQIGTENNIYNNVLFFPVTKKSGTKTSSQHIFDLYTLTNKITKYCCKTHMESVANDPYKPFDHVEHIVFIDDMIGSGDTMKKFLKQTFEKFPFLKEKRLYLIVLEAFSNGIKIIKDFAQPTNIEIYYSKLHAKAFDDGHIFTGDKLEKAIQTIQQLELKINDNDPKHVLGYKKSEALMAFFHNTPNNTLSSFWKENEVMGWKPLFRPRNDHIPNYMQSLPKESVDSLGKDKQKRDNINYGLKQKRAVNNGF
ncbi:hypothetical protein OB236_16625 [Paenibacillus sp. WQ 127069]|uniref:PRTase-CE domain-containing protein n=1 Tax=Paenibacillus baimaensis TaxID=2982185 RepID=A0ABT2UHX4_9BACL|nr:hypothetical protein [Paenibacillus sp. WQ 127069]MCU6793731.1 hypothetical protein [Paenibacillus sp. WQ 127069]